MKEKIKIQKGSAQIPLLTVIIVSVVVVLGISYGLTEYHRVSKLIERAEQLTNEERYNEAIEMLKLAQMNWLVKNLGIREQEIANIIEENETLFEDKLEYNQGIEEFNKGNWEKAKELLLKVSEISPYYQEAKSKIEEARKRTAEERQRELDEKLKALAKCLNEKGVKFYGTYWCGFCIRQKEMFDQAAVYLPYIECAPDRATEEELAMCREANVTSIPDWRFPDGHQELGMLPLEKLAELSGCQL